jgi:ribosome recycling factor
MNETVENIISNTSQLMRKAIQHLELELSRVRAGKANPQILDGIMVEYYGNPTPLGQVANIATPDARTITLQPWEKNMFQPIERAIIASNIGLNPSNDGNIIRLFLPPLTEERRKELVKRVNGEGETAKVAIRSIRRDGIEAIKKLQKDGMSEDAAKDAESNIQAITDKEIIAIDNVCKEKEKEIMTV